MLVPISWLREYVPLLPEPQKLAQLLTMAGFEVEEIKNLEGEIIFSVKVTSNRGDCLSVLGLAREAGALLGKKVKAPRFALKETAIPVRTKVSVRILDEDLCSRYDARVIEGIRVAPSPEWMRRRLELCGVRSINNVVDATNYVCLELGQPLHAFDLQRLAGKSILVRRARNGETLITIDGIPRTLSDDMLVIADAQHPVALAGVMGGKETEITEQTADILLESAHFKPESIRSTSKKLKLTSESSYRFERFVDPELVPAALDRVSHLIRTTAGGHIYKGTVDVYPRHAKPKKILLRKDRLDVYLGNKIALKEAASILNRLGLKTSPVRKTALKVTCPTFRTDLRQQEDLIEEIARVYGYDNIPVTLPASSVSHGGYAPVLQFERIIKNILFSCGLCEARTHSLVSSETFQKFRFSEEYVRDKAVPLKNPLTEDAAYLRTDLLMALLLVEQQNALLRNKDIHVFEVGKVYGQKKPGEVEEERKICVFLSGSLWENGWNIAPQAREVDFSFLRGVLDRLLLVLGIKHYVLEKADQPCFYPGRCSGIRVGEGISEYAGFAGEIHPEVASAFSLGSRAYAFELSFDALHRASVLSRTFQPLPKYPSVDRDLAIVVKSDVSCSEIQQCIAEAAPGFLESVRLFDLYTGSPVASGYKSLAFSLTFRHPEKTLRSEEVENYMSEIREALKNKLLCAIRE